MTMQPTDDPPPRDPRFDTAWRAASSEEPPPALDTAIVAAAHREAGAKPQSLSAQAAMRARRRWWPLAAAATVAVIAIGVVQRAGHDDLVGLPSGRTVVSDMPAQSTTRTDTAPSANGGSAEGRLQADSVARQSPAGVQPGSRTVAERHAAPDPTALQQKMAESLASAMAPAEKKPELAANSAAPPPEPFPAAEVKSDATAARDAAATAPIAERAAESPALQRNEGGAASAKLAVPAPPPAVASTPPASPASPPSPSAAPTMPTPRASFAESSQFAASPAAHPSTTAKPAMPGAAMDARAKDGAPLPIPDWIALIRRLRGEGNVDEAARELAAFRTAHTDHEKLLPPDLRDWHPPEK
jgi:hypothetical protein